MSERYDIYFVVGESIDEDFPSLEVDLTTYTATLHVKETYLDDSETADLSASVTMDASGVINLSIADTSAMDWDQYIYDIKLVDGSGDISYPFYGLISRIGE